MAEYKGVEMTPTMFDHLKGASTGVRNMDYTWRDISLYSLSIGCKRPDTPYFFERDKRGLHAFPTFAVIPYLNNVTMRTITPVPDGTNEIYRAYLERLLGYLPNGLHMAMEMIFDTPLDPYGGTFVVTDHLNGVFDRGEGKGTVADCGMDVYDQAGRHIAELHSYHFSDAFGGFGGPAFKAPSCEFPDRAPDINETEYMIPEIAAFYRLVGDTYRHHVDFDFAKEHGYPAPFNMGMCTYAYGMRMIAHKVIPYEPERIKYVYAQVRSLCFPGQNVTAQGWIVEPGVIHWKMLSEEGKVLIGNGIIRYEA